jgi:hypothetical protein
VILATAQAPRLPHIQRGVIVLAIVAILAVLLIRKLLGAIGARPEPAAVPTTGGWMAAFLAVAGCAWAIYRMKVAHPAAAAAAVPAPKPVPTHTEIVTRIVNHTHTIHAGPLSGWPLAAVIVVALGTCLALLMGRTS